MKKTIFKASLVEVLVVITLLTLLTMVLLEAR